MREFTSADGRRWTASVSTTTGADYKGRFFLLLEPEGGGTAFALDDIRWNSERTARRTLETMSEVELRRRLRSALGREGALRS